MIRIPSYQDFQKKFDEYMNQVRMGLDIVFEFEGADIVIKSIKKDDRGPGKKYAEDIFATVSLAKTTPKN